MRKTLFLIIMLLTSVMSKADDITYSVTTNYSTYQSYNLSNAYDGNTSTYFWSSEVQTTGKYILIEFSENVDLTEFSTYSSSSTDYPNTCNELQVSSDNSTWTTVGTFTSSQTTTFSNITTAKNIKYARIYGTSVYTKWLVINEITMTYTAAETEDPFTRTRDVTPGTWQSFCLPFNMDIDDLQDLFDYIYIPYKGEILDLYDDTEEAPEMVKRRLSARKATTATDDLYSFAYYESASSAYDFYITDFTNAEGVVIPQGMPFFAKVKGEGTETTTLTLTGYLFDDETALSGIQTKTFPIYIDKTIQTLDTDGNTFTSIGYLSADNTFNASATIFTINEDGSFTSISADEMTANHAYLMASKANTVTLHPIDLSKLPYTGDTIEGDLNGDGLVTIVDAAQLIDILNDTTKTNAKADLNSDGTIDLQDLTLLLNKILQK